MKSITSSTKVMLLVVWVCLCIKHWSLKLNEWISELSESWVYFNPSVSKPGYCRRHCHTRRHSGHMVRFSGPQLLTPCLGTSLGKWLIQASQCDPCGHTDMYKVHIKWCLVDTALCEWQNIIGRNVLKCEPPSLCPCIFCAPSTDSPFLLNNPGTDPQPPLAEKKTSTLHTIYYNTLSPHYIGFICETVE